MKGKWQKTGLKSPICVTWEITAKCNLHCKHCLSSSVAFTHDELSLEEAMALIDHIVEMEVFYINIGGGEPFLREDVFDIIAYTDKKKLPIQLSTNGTLVNEETAAFLSKIKDIRIQVSLDGASALVNDSIRGDGSFAGALKALQLLSSRGIELSINFVVTSKNFQELESCYRLAREYKAVFRVSRLRPSGQARRIYEEYHLSTEQHRQLYYWLKKHPDVSTGDSFFFLSVLGKSLFSMNSCGAATMTCSIGPNGDVYPCAFLMDREKAGNIRREQLADIWRNSGMFKNFRSKTIPECLNCNHFATCGGGCRAVSFYYSGEFFKRDPECLIFS